MSVDKSFLGTGWSFPPAFNKKGAVNTVTAEDDIQESLHILLSTAPGERVMQPTYGCGLRSHIFEEMTESTVTVISDLVTRAILFFESRVSVESVTIDFESDDDFLQGLVKINILYTVRATNNRHNMVYPFYFTEGTNVKR